MKYLQKYLINIKDKTTTFFLKLFFKFKITIIFVIFILFLIFYFNIIYILNTSFNDHIKLSIYNIFLLLMNWVEIKSIINK